MGISPSARYCANPNADEGQPKQGNDGICTLVGVLARPLYHRAADAIGDLHAVHREEQHGASITVLILMLDENVWQRPDVLVARGTMR